MPTPIAAEYAPKKPSIRQLASTLASKVGGKVGEVAKKVGEMGPVKKAGQFLDEWVMPDPADFTSLVPGANLIPKQQSIRLVDKLMAKQIGASSSPIGRSLVDLLYDNSRFRKYAEDFLPQGDGVQLVPAGKIGKATSAAHYANNAGKQQVFITDHFTHARPEERAATLAHEFRHGTDSMDQINRYMRGNPGSDKADATQEYIKDVNFTVNDPDYDYFSDPSEIRARTSEIGAWAQAQGSPLSPVAARAQAINPGSQYMAGPYRNASPEAMGRLLDEVGATYTETVDAAGYMARRLADLGQRAKAYNLPINRSNGTTDRIGIISSRALNPADPYDAQFIRDIGQDWVNGNRHWGWNAP